MGKKFAAFNAQGNITAYYDDVDSPVPASVTNVIEITDAQWQACLSTPGYTVQNGILVAPTLPTTAQIAAQQAAQAVASSVQSALATGLVVTSTSTPGINGTYPLDAATQNKIAAIVLFTQVNGDFPGGASVYPMPDILGAMHIFPSVAVFDEWSTAIANHVAAIDLYGASVSGAALPVTSVAIA